MPRVLRGPNNPVLSLQLSAEGIPNAGTLLHRSRLIYLAPDPSIRW